MDTPTLKEMQLELKMQLSKIKNHGKRRRVARDVKKNIERKYGIVL